MHYQEWILGCYKISCSVDILSFPHTQFFWITDLSHLFRTFSISSDRISINIVNILYADSSTLLCKSKSGFRADTCCQSYPLTNMMTLHKCWMNNLSIGLSNLNIRLTDITNQTNNLGIGFVVNLNLVKSPLTKFTIQRIEE